MADSTDPQLRLQNIALEHAELVARRSMTWAESTNRTTMFMTIVGAAVVGLALLAQTISGRDLPLLALLILAFVLLVGMTSLLRVVHLDEEDMRWVQGLNRLRHVRLELDPGLAPYLVTSPHDDFDSIISAYGGDDASWTRSFSTLVVLIMFANSVLVAAVVGLLAVNLGYGGGTALAAALTGAVVFVLVMGAWFYRMVGAASARFAPVVPAPRTSDSAPAGIASAPGEEPPQP